jgi:hypothetical protein
MSTADEWICAEFANLAQVLYDYDPCLRLEMVPTAEWGNLIDKSKIFKVIDTERNQIVLFADSLSNPAEILARVWGMDQKHNNVVQNLDLKNAAIQALRMRENLDEMEAQRDFVMFIAKNTKSRWTHDGRVRDEEYNDLGPVRTHIT